MTPSISESIKMWVWWSDFAGRICHHTLALMIFRRPEVFPFSLVILHQYCVFCIPESEVTNHNNKHSMRDICKNCALRKEAAVGGEGRGGQAAVQGAFLMRTRDT